MPTVNLAPTFGVGWQALDNSGAVLTGGKLYTYAAGTTTPAATYTTSTGNVAHANPIILDSAGRVQSGGEIWLADGVAYKFVLKTSTDTLIVTYDNITGINSNAFAFLNQQEIVTATSGQTVFNLGINYQPGTNSLSVFVDGVNQYGPGAQYSYVETDSNTVTFNVGLHVGAEVKFTTTQQQGAGVTDSSQVTYDPPFTGSVPTNVEAKLAQTVSVKDFGAVGDGVTDDTAAIQAAIDSGTAAKGGFTVYFPPGEYKITNTLVIGARRITLKGPTLTGSNSASLLKSGAYANLDFINASTNIIDTFSVFDLQFQGDGTSGTGNGITLGNASTFVADCRIQNCWFNQIPNAALNMINVGGYHISSNGFEQSAYAIFIPGTVISSKGNNVIENNRFYSNVISIFIGYSQYDTVVGNLFDNCGQNNDTTGAIVCSTSSTEIRGLSIAANKFRANYNDVVFLGTADKAAHVGVTTNSVISNHSEFAQRHFFYSAGSDGVAVLSNFINDPGQAADNTFAAIDLQASAHTTVDGNVVRYAGAIRPSYSLQSTASVTTLKIGQNDFVGATADVSLSAGSYAYMVAGEENSFTPTMFGSTSAGTTTYTNQIGSYQRNGQWVHFSLRVSWSAATGTGNMRFGGLPYSAVNVSNLLQACTVGYATLDASDTTALTAYIAPGNSYINLNKYAAGITTALAVENSGDVVLSGSYRT